MQSRERQARTSWLMVACLLSTWVSATPAFAVDIVDDPVQIDERATQLINTTNLLCWEMHRFHQQQPDYPESYRVAKGIWSQAGQLQEALRVGPVETEALVQQVAEMNNAFSQLEKSLSKWSSGDRSLNATTGGPVQRTVVRPGVQVDIPFVGVLVGRPPVVVTENGPPQMERRRFHANARGSKRSLERDVAAVKAALEYLSEDAGLTPSASPQTTLKPSLPAPVPQSPEPGPAFADPDKGSKPK